AMNLPSYAEAVGAGAFMIGLLIAIYDFAELFAKPMAGLLADRRGMKRVLLLGLVVNWLRVVGKAEASQMEQRQIHALHAVAERWTGMSVVAACCARALLGQR